SSLRMDRTSVSDGMVWEDMSWLPQKLPGGIECAIFLPQCKIKMKTPRASSPPNAAEQGEKASIEAVEMMDRAVTMPDTEAVCGGDRGVDPGLGVAHGGFHAFALGKPGGNRRGQRAAGAMGVFGRNARRGQ